MIDSLAEVYRCVAWLTKFTDASRGYQKIMVKKNPQYSRYTQAEIRSTVLKVCTYKLNDAGNRYTFREDDLWHNYFTKEPMLCERLAELDIDSIEQLTATVLGVQLDRKMTEGQNFSPALPPADDDAM